MLADISVKHERFFLESKHQKVMSIIDEIFCCSSPINIPSISKGLRVKNEYKLIGGQFFIDDLLNYNFINQRK